MRREHVCLPAKSCDISYVYGGGFDEDSVGVDVVIEDDDAHHHPHAEEEGVLAAEAAGILPKTHSRRDAEGSRQALTFNLYLLICVCVCARVCADSRRLQHDSTHIGHSAETICGFLQWKTFILHRAT